MKFTEGNWKAEYDETGGMSGVFRIASNLDDKNATIAHVDVADYADPSSVYLFRLVEAEANAKLLAASSEMYKALLLARRAFRPHPHFPGQYLVLTVDLERLAEAIDAALAKADGK